MTNWYLFFFKFLKVLSKSASYIIWIKKKIILLDSHCVQVVGPFRHTNLDLFTSSEEEFSFPSLFPVQHNNSQALLESAGGRLPTSDELPSTAPNVSALDHMAFALPTTGLGNFSLPTTQGDQPVQGKFAVKINDKARMHLL